MIQRISIAPLYLVTAVILSGCVTGHQHGPLAERSNVRQATASYNAARTQIYVSGAKVLARIHPEASTFQRVVWHLQSLGYLPIVHASVRDDNNTEIRHDRFLWPVPDALQTAADQYAWNANNPFIRGAVIQFERANGLLGAKGVSEGNLHKSVIRAILSTSAIPDPFPWQWVYVTKASGTRQPEQLHIWQGNGQRWIWNTRVNTGVLGATPNGTWPIYQRLPSTTMRGVFPIPVSPLTYVALKGQQVPQWTGSALMQSAVGTINDHPVRWQPYNDPGIKWVNYFDAGRGIHYYPRAAYGFPQSAGCVEEPRKAARVAYGLLRYGVPVTVSGAAFLAHKSLSKPDPKGAVNHA